MDSTAISAQQSKANRSAERENHSKMARISHIGWTSYGWRAPQEAVCPCQAPGREFTLADVQKEGARDDGRKKAACGILRATDVDARGPTMAPSTTNHRGARQMQPIDPHILFDDEEEDDREVGYTPESIETDDPVLRFALHAMIADVLSLPFDGRPEVTAAYAARGIVGKAVNATTVPFLTIESIFGPHDFDDLLDRIMDLTISRERYERIHVMHELRNSFMPFDLWTKT